jgi:hypothetical protein
MKDMHINLNDCEITCGNCDAVVTPDDADEKPSSIYRAGFYTCPNCFINITISAETAKDANIAILQKLDGWY